MLNVWISSLRLKTIPLACCGIITGNALAYNYSQHLDGWIFIFSLLTAIALQIVSNLANDYGDVIKGTDSNKIVDTGRGMQSGVITPRQMKFAIIIACIVAACLGVILIILACRSVFDMVIFIALGLLSIVAAILYTVGNKAYGYYGLGDLSVFLFFGYASVMGSFFLQTHHLGGYSLLPATAVGMLAVLVLNVNNIRDMHEDEAHGKRTVAVRLGGKRSRYYHLLLLTLTLCFLSLFVFVYQWHNYYGWLFLLVLPLFIWNGYAVYHYKQTMKLHKQLVVAIKINIFTLSLFSIGLFLG